MVKTFAGRMQRYIGRPFQEGAYGPEAYDCVGFIWRYLRDQGINVPDNWNDLNEHNYFHLARGSKKRECDTLRKWVLTLGKEIPANQRLAGDILLCEIKDILFVTVYCGNNHAISVSREQGVRVISIDSKYIKSVTAIRCTNNG
jgi:cell wall-associated NlpC family hydrolase